MTATLKAVVEAMALGLQDQAGERYPEATRTVQDPDRIFLNGDFDLEKVVRAALLPALDAAFRAGFEAGADFADCREGKWRDAVDALGETDAWEKYRREALK